MALRQTDGRLSHLRWMALWSLKTSRGRAWLRSRYQHLCLPSMIFWRYRSEISFPCSLMHGQLSIFPVNILQQSWTIPMYTYFSHSPLRMTLKQPSHPSHACLTLGMIICLGWRMKDLMEETSSPKLESTSNTRERPSSSHSLGKPQRSVILAPWLTHGTSKEPVFALLILSICFLLPNFCVISPLSPLMDWMLCFLICSPLRSLRHLGFREYWKRWVVGDLRGISE